MKNQKKIGDIVIPALKSFLEKRGFVHSRIITSWSRIADDASDWSIPIKISFPSNSNDNGILHIKVIPSHAPELSMLSQKIINKINVMFGYKAITEIRLHHGKINKLNEEKKIPLNNLSSNNKEVRNINSELHEIKNLNLLNALTKLGIGLHKD